MRPLPSRIAHAVAAAFDCRGSIFNLPALCAARTYAIGSWADLLRCGRPAGLPDPLDDLPGLRQQLVATAYDHVRVERSWDACAQPYRALYDRLLGGPA